MVLRDRERRLGEIYSPTLNFKTEKRLHSLDKGGFIAAFANAKDCGDKAMRIRSTRTRHAYVTANPTTRVGIPAAMKIPLTVVPIEEAPRSARAI